MTTTFLRLLAHDDKPAALAAAVDALRGGEECPDAFAADPDSFKQVPGSPFAYWVSLHIKHLFVELAAFQSASRSAQAGLSTKNDFRFLRAKWEVLPQTIISVENPKWLESPQGYQEECLKRSWKKQHWAYLGKGGEFAEYYSDLHLVVNWVNDGAEIEKYLLEKFPYLGKSANWLLHRECSYFYSGITWSLRTQKRISFRVLPAGSMFGHKGPSAFTQHQELPSILAIVNSHAFFGLVSLQMAFGSYEVGVIRRTPIPNIDNPQGAHLGELALACVKLKRDMDRANETSHVFHLPALLQVAGDSLAERASAWTARVADAEAQLAAHQGEIDEIAFALYGIDGEDRAAIEGGDHRGTEAQSPEEPEEEEDEDGSAAVSASDTLSLCASVVSYLAGCAFGRFDIRYATGELAKPTLPDPFAPLPACSPGMLTGNDGLPLRAAPAGYPLPIDGDGILVDDSSHPDDIIGRLRAGLELVFGPRAEAIEREACAALGVAELRDYLRRPGAGGFWADHIRRYSKSRRKAPIYWLLQSPKRSYALWIYLHRLDDDTLSKALVSYVEPKLRLEDERLSQLIAAKGGLSGRELRQAERDAERQEATIADVRELRDRLDRAVRLGLAPDLNDGVVLTIAPLHELVPWKEAKQHWDELLAGKYAWSSIGKQLREKGLTK